MTGVLARAGRLFVAPAAECAAFSPPRPRPPMAGVLAAEPELLVAAGAAAASLRREAGTAAALVCAWRGHDDGPPSPPAPRAPGAARIAAKLRRRGLAARACGALCVVELPAEAPTAVATFRDAVAAADVPAVLAVARRETPLDPLLASAQRLVLALGEAADPVLAEVAAAGLAQLGPPVERRTTPCASLARQAARLGLSGFAAPAPATETA